MTSMTRRARCAMACAAAATAMALGAQGASAHTSAFAGHYTLTGEQWQLVYLDHYDSGAIPGWRHSLLVPALKDGTVHRLPLDPAGISGRHFRTFPI